MIFFFDWFVWRFKWNEWMKWKEVSILSLVCNRIHAWHSFSLNCLLCCWTLLCPQGSAHAAGLTWTCSLCPLQPRWFPHGNQPTSDRFVRALLTSFLTCVGKFTCQIWRKISNIYISIKTFTLVLILRQRAGFLILKYFLWTVLCSHQETFQGWRFGGGVS